MMVVPFSANMRFSARCELPVSKGEDFLTGFTDFILGAQGDTQNTRILIQSKAFHNLLLESIKGRYGEYTKAAVLTDVSIFFRKADEEVEKLDLTFKKSDGSFGITIEPETGTDWTSYEIALMNAIGQGFLPTPIFS
jgi:hypothetical protein